LHTRFAVTVALAAAVAAVVPAIGGSAPRQAQPEEYVVLYAAGVSPAAARAAIAATGATILKENTAVGVATVRSQDAGFVAAVRAQAALAGAARNRPIGEDAPLLRPKDSVEHGERGGNRGQRGKRTGTEPLSALQWDMAMIHATPAGSYRAQRGSKGVLVGILDTGVDGSHPDIAPNFDERLSRNFTTDVPLIDGPCAEEPDHSCSDPADVDENEHGTHVAGTIGAALNGLGIGGVAPNVTLVNLRAGQDSGYFFLQPTIDALTYAGDHGIDVVNMSYYIDPWLFNCASNPLDSPAAQLEQRTIVAATNRALDYAHAHGVTLIAAAGNEHTDLSHRLLDPTSPDFPPGSEYVRPVDGSCLSMPSEGHHVIDVSAVGPSTFKADYSNWGGNVVVSAPGGWFRDFVGTPQYRTPENEILSAYPASLAAAAGVLDPDGSPNDPFVVRDCQRRVCGYYQYLQGTSMASPHAVGVAALIVSEYGQRDRRNGGLTLSPDRVGSILRSTATDHACPTPPVLDYTAVGRTPDYTALCVGSTAFNSIWGDGIVDALAAVSAGDDD
jgi:subtilisin family serine protease